MNLLDYILLSLDLSNLYLSEENKQHKIKTDKYKIPYKLHVHVF